MSNRTPTLFDDMPIDPGSSGELDKKLPELLAGRLELELIRFLESEYGDLSTEEKLAVILTVQFRLAGHVCLPMEKTLRELGNLLDIDASVIKLLPQRPMRLNVSAIMGEPGKGTPFVLDDDKLYQHRYHKMESILKEWIDQKSDSQASTVSDKHVELLHDLFDGEESDETGEPNWQKVAVLLSAFKPFIIISGGPGTGKTTTVARLLVMHQRSGRKPLKIALAAPTGKAAGRMGEALKDGMERLGISDAELENYPTEAQTIHRLLQGVEERGLLPPVREKKLPYDMVIIDEASMVDLSLMNRLIKHLAPETKLVLLGDKNQLASVEAGSVFADLCGKPGNLFRTGTVEKLEKGGIRLTGIYNERDLSNADDSIVYLTKSYRFSSDSGIGTLSEAVNNGIESEKEVNEIFSTFNDVEHQLFGYHKPDFEQMMLSVTERVKQASGIQNAEELLDFWKKQIWLTVVRRGLSGSDRLNQLAEQTLATKRAVRMQKGWYSGRPVIVTRNDYDLGVYNGDFGICIKTGEDERLKVCIQSGSGIKTVRPERLRDFKPAFFLTVHKSQGSEFDTINLLMPKEDVPVLTKELLYTAVTRAKKKFMLYGSKTLFVKGSNRRTERYSGIS